ncbi:hypothetical protein A1O1_07762 [Capronia coronata CBS 617.96]|uniref:Exocyst complex protein EXO70 n=1 Tax=Capronia coronata CBS 617.96 TaxID=1182541 RepID=W9XMC9_9EURO|nr:uncharacterized protein A1O1_07762 [Capronia coronata CBS 617.96]EXJ81697.1 hypothetical protein A1O1_07762 [Capronia coronata CBS 617.96]
MAAPRNAAFAEESAEVEVLIASLAKTKDLTKRIAASLVRLEVSGQIVKEAIGPIYSNTQQLETTSRNIEKVNEAIERLRQPLDARGREEGIIRAGPKSSGLPQYLGALRRVDKALTDLGSTNLRANQAAISEFHNLLLTGINQLNDTYRQMLQEDAQPIEPLHYITKQIPFPTIAQDKVQYLSQMANAIASAGAQSARLGQRDDDAAARIYAEVRGDYLHSSLQNLATASISTSRRREKDSAIYREGSSGIGAYANAVEAMFLAESENTSRIFRGDAGKVLSMTCAKALATFTRTLSELNSVIKSRILTDCFLAYEILDLITPLGYRLESRTGQLRPQIVDALRPVRDTARASLGELIVQTKKQADSITTLPPNGSTIPLVAQTAQRLQNLATFDRPLLVLLASIGDGKWRSANTAGAGMSSNSSLNLELTPSTENPTLLSHYLLDIVDTLLGALNARSQMLHSKKSLQGIFQLNNVAVLTRAVQSSPDLARYLGINPHNAKLDAFRKSGSSLYLSAWRDPSTYLLDTIHTTGAARPLSGQAIDSTSIIKSLSSKDKDKIKEKFKLFNASFDELVVRHKSLHMENEVRSSMSREIQAMIEPLYARFWDRYHEVDKGKGKVVKYSKGELSAMLASL